MSRQAISVRVVFSKGVLTPDREVFRSRIIVNPCLNTEQVVDELSSQMATAIKHEIGIWEPRKMHREAST